MKFIFQICILQFIAAAVIPLNASAGPEWTLAKEGNGIRVYTRTAENSKFAEFKGEAIINSRFEVVVEVLQDIPFFTKWMDTCKYVKILSHNDENDYRLHFINHLPWPLKDREAVVSAVMKLDRTNKIYTADITSISDINQPPSNNLVRMSSLSSCFIIKFLDQEQTMITFNIKADPGGNIPAIFVNTFSKDHPFKTISGLKKMVQMDKYKTLGRQSKYKLASK